MRNVFDQYSQPENRLTHGLICSLEADRKLLRPFLSWLGVTKIPATKNLILAEQQAPGESESGEEVSDERRGLPDAVIHDGESWAVLIEAKVQARVDAGQLRRHIATAKRRGFPEPHLVIISVDAVRGHPAKEWRQVYQWFRARDRDSEWASRFADYLEVFEARAISQGYDIRGTLTMFDGLRFDDSNPYTWAEGKRLIRLLGDELQARPDLGMLGVDPKGSRRSAITGKGERKIWDFIPLAISSDANSFTDFPHFTMVVGRDGALAATTIPNGTKGGLKKKLAQLGASGFSDLLVEVNQRLQAVVSKSRGAQPMVYATQRHYPSQRSASIKDARVDADLGVIAGDTRRGVKAQPQWVDGIFAVLVNKQSNVQWGIEVQFSYDCPIVRSKACEDLFAESWSATKPLLDFILD